MFVNLQNIRLHYTIAGTGPHVVILPGWGCNTTTYNIISKHLAQKYTVYTLDLPGQGLSPLPEKPFGTPDYATLVADFLQQLHIDNPILIGHSHGGKIAIYLIAKQLVDSQKLILISSAGIKRSKTIKQHLRILFYKLCKNLSKLPFLRFILESKLASYRKNTGSKDYRNASGVMRVTLVRLVNEDWRKLLPKISIPTLLLWGEKDTDTPLSNAHIMMQHLPNAKLTTFNNAGHFPFIDNPQKFMTQIDEFL